MTIPARICRKDLVIWKDANLLKAFLHLAGCLSCVGEIDP